jgi:hypothetical protein
MVIIHVQVGKNFIEDVILNGGFKVNIITKKSREHLGLIKPKPMPYNLRMVHQTIVKPLSLFKKFKIFVHGILYVTFTIIDCSVLESNYSMLLGRPWLKDVKIFHDQGNNIITIQGIDAIKTILVIEKLKAPTKQPKMLVCYDSHFGIFHDKKI